MIKYVKFKLCIMSSQSRCFIVIIQVKGLIKLYHTRKSPPLTLTRARGVGDDLLILQACQSVNVKI